MKLSHAKLHSNTYGGRVEWLQLWSVFARLIGGRRKLAVINGVMGPRSRHGKCIVLPSDSWKTAAASHVPAIFLLDVVFHFSIVLRTAIGDFHLWQIAFMSSFFRRVMRSWMRFPSGRELSIRFRERISNGEVCRLHAVSSNPCWWSGIRCNDDW